MQIAEDISTEASILARITTTGKLGLPVAAARAFLKLAFSAEDRERMHELVVKNQSSPLPDAERRELDSYVRVGRLLDLLAAQARNSLARRAKTNIST